MGNKSKVRVCFAETAYSLFIYLLYSTESEIYNTYFFVGNGLEKSIRDNLPHLIFIDWYKYKNSSFIKRNLWRVYLNISSYFKWPFLKGASYFGQDHLIYVPPILKGNQMIVIEDGLANYDIKCIHFNQTKLKWKNKYFNNILFGKITCEDKFGGASFATEVLLSRPDIAPLNIRIKSKKIDIYELWKNIPLSHKIFIKKIFNITREDEALLLESETIILTQPFNDIVQSEEEIIRIYKDIYNHFPNEKKLIKTHPRDTIDYRRFFDKVYYKPCPIELLLLIGGKFKKAITISSSSILSFPHDTKKIFIGTKYYPIINEWYANNNREFNLSDLGINQEMENIENFINNEKDSI